MDSRPTKSAALVVATAEELHQVRAVLPDQIEIDNTLQLSLARRV